MMLAALSGSLAFLGLLELALVVGRALARRGHDPHPGTHTEGHYEPRTATIYPPAVSAEGMPVPNAPGCLYGPHARFPSPPRNPRPPPKLLELVTCRGFRLPHNPELHRLAQVDVILWRALRELSVTPEARA